jgi:biotin/methionine sulfoxide reductase
MVQKLTAAHWGIFEIDGFGETAHLKPIARDHQPARIGSGWLDAMRDSDSRILRPSIRKGWLENRDTDRNGDAEFVELPWDEALDITAQELRRVVDTHGNGALFAGSYGWASAGRFHHAQSQLRRFLNTIGGFVNARDTYSHAGAEVIFPHLTGMSNKVFQDEMTSWPLVAQHCETLLAFGGISKRAAQIASAGTSSHETEDWLAKAKGNGCKLVNISPLRTDMAAHLAADWVGLRPGTDCALILALAYEVFRLGRADRAFLDRYTHGAATFEAYVTGAQDGTPKTPEWAAALCDIPAQTIRDLADRISTTRTMIAMAWGMQRADRGEITLWAGLSLACLLGQIGQPGTGYAFGYGCSEIVGRATRWVDWPSVPQGRNPVRDYIPVARIADMLEYPRTAYRYNGETRTYPDAKMIWWSGGNPFHHHQDLNRLDRVWRNPETVVVLDHSWTATARRADIVLPTTSALERDDLMVNRRDPALVYMSAAMPPKGEARDDYAILSGLAARMGTEAAFCEGRDVEGWLRHLWQGCAQAAQSFGASLPAFDRFKEDGIFDLPEPETLRIQFGAFINDPINNPLQTPSGKIEIESQSIAAMGLADCGPIPTWQTPVEGLTTAAPDQLHLVSGQPDTRLHSQNDSGSVAKAAKVAGREACWMHPDAAAARGLHSGDIVRLESPRGACLAGLILTPEMRRDCISLPTGAWLDLREIDGERICVHGNPNMLTLDQGSTSLSQGNIAHTTLVRVSKWDKPVPEIHVHSQPRFA